jgi:predicted AAA+ superfamily ATPase
LVDSLPEILVIASGSSSFEMLNKVGEPLTGRQTIYKLYPVSIMEFVEMKGIIHVIQSLSDYLIYGTYPETLNATNYEARRDYLITLRNSYPFKDILEVEDIRTSYKMIDLLKLIAFQIGTAIFLDLSSNGIQKRV